MHIFTLNKIYLHSRHYFTYSNCIFMQLQGIVFIQLQGNDILVLLSRKSEIHSKNIYSFTRSIIISGNYILSRNCIHFKELISSFKENIFIQGLYIHSRKYIHQGTYIRSSSRPYVHSRKLYSLNIVAFAE